MRMRIFAACAVLLIGLFAPAAANADGRLSVTLPDGSPPKDLFTDLTLVPGDTTDETLIVSQNTDETVRTGVRLERESPAGELDDAVEVTLSGFGKSVTLPLREALSSDSPTWLGELEPDTAEPMTIRVHLPEQAGNDTKRKQAKFEVIVTAAGDGAPPTSTPTDPPGEANAETDSSADSTGSSDSADDRTSADADSAADPAGGADSSSSADEDASAGTDAASSAGANSSATADEKASADASVDSDADGPGGDLPRTGTEALITVAIAAALLAVGLMALRASRRRRNTQTD